MTDESRGVSRRALLRTAAGAGVVGATAGTAAAQGETHTVEMTNDLVYVPEEVTVQPGDTVVWENVGTVGHTVTAYEDDIPGDADYFASGGFDSEQAARDGFPDGQIGGGESYEHTFEVEGTYDYFCIPHEGAGMLGTVEVGTGDGGGHGDGGGGGGVPSVSARAQALVLTAVGAGASALALVYFIMRFGGDYGPDETD